MLGSPTRFACFKCWVCGHLVGMGKRVFTNSYLFLPLDHPLRSNARLVGLNNPDNTERTGLEEPPRQRTFIEIFMNKDLPDTQPVLLVGEKTSYYDGAMHTHHLPN